MNKAHNESSKHGICLVENEKHEHFIQNRFLYYYILYNVKTQMTPALQSEGDIYTSSFHFSTNTSSIPSGVPPQYIYNSLKSTRNPVLSTIYLQDSIILNQGPAIGNSSDAMRQNATRQKKLVCLLAIWWFTTTVHQQTQHWRISMRYPFSQSQDQL